MRDIYRFAIILLLVFAFSGCSHAVKIGERSYGYVEKEYYGNQTSSETIAIIIGVHPLESGIHEAVKAHLRSMTLTRRYVIYHVHVTANADDYSRGRMNGQLLARDFVVPDVRNEKPMLVVDCHENRYMESGYAYPRFIYPISKGTATMNYGNQIVSRMPFLRIYTPPQSTSPAYVTIPIASMGYSTIIYEAYAYDTSERKLCEAAMLIESLDSLKRVSVSETKVISSYPTTGAITPRRTMIKVRFSERISSGKNWNRIVLKNQRGRRVYIKKWVKGNTLYIKPSMLSKNTSYTLTVPFEAVKGSSPIKTWSVTFRTGRK